MVFTTAPCNAIALSVIHKLEHWDENSTETLFSILSVKTMMMAKGRNNHAADTLWRIHTVDPIAEPPHGNFKWTLVEELNRRCDNDSNSNGGHIRNTWTSMLHLLKHYQNLFYKTWWVGQVSVTIIHGESIKTTNVLLFQISRDTFAPQFIFMQHHRWNTFQLNERSH